MSPSGSLGYPVSLAASQALLRAPPPPSRPQIGPQHTELPHEGASALRRQRLVPCAPRKHASARGSFRQRAPPRLKSQTPGLGAQGSTPRGSRAGAPRSSKARRNLLEMLQICKRAGLDVPLQTATRSWFFFFFFSYQCPAHQPRGLRLRPAPAQTGRCLLSYEFKLRFALEFRSSAAEARLSGEEGIACWTSGAGRAPGRAPGAQGLVRSDTHWCPPLGLLEWGLRLDFELDPSLSLPGRAGLERLGDPADYGTAGCIRSSIGVFFSPQG